MLFADQIGLPVSPCRAKPGVAWMRFTTDLPAACMGLLAHDTDFKSYIRSLRACGTEAVFSAKDPLPGLAEILLVPYLAIKRGF
jgi:predicted ATP-grasp superfamily ATP-dependent carboligase